jgi:hypothetical protein
MSIISKTEIPEKNSKRNLRQKIHVRMEKRNLITDTLIF